MAGDWIEMRVGIVNHPKVLALAEKLSYDSAYQDWSGLHGFVPSIGGSDADFSEGVSQAIRTTRYVTVTALLKFWGYANEHAKDDFISSLRISDIDEIVQVPGFGAALESINWAIYDKNKHGIFLPNFSEHNATASDRTNSDRQRRYRERKKAGATCNASSNVTMRNVTVTSSSNDREEKRREEKDIPKTPRSKKTSIPEGWKPSPSTIERLSSEFGFTNGDAERYTAAFVDACKAKGYEYANFDAAFCGCVRKDWPGFRNGAQTMPKREESHRPNWS